MKLIVSRFALRGTPVLVLLIGLMVPGILTTRLTAQEKLTPVNEAEYQKLVASHRGKIVMVDFWATWCVPCRAELPQLLKLSSRLRSLGFELVTISADEPGQEAGALSFLRQSAAPSPQYVKKAADDDKFAASIDAKWDGALPAIFLYNRSGKKVRSFIGETPIKDLEAAIDKLL